MAEVTVILKGQLRDVEAVLLHMEKVLSLKQVPTRDPQSEPEDISLYLFTASADEPPGGDTEYDFSRVLNTSVYRRILRRYRESWVDFQYLETEGMFRHDALWWQRQQAFMKQLMDYMDSISEEY